MINFGNIFYIRVDGSSSIGSGHIVRCVAIAKEIEKRGTTVSFVSSDKESLQILSKYGYKPILVDGNPRFLGDHDAKRLRAVMKGGDKVLVDSYGVTDDFFKSCKNLGMKVIYIDDMYTFEMGNMSIPIYRDVYGIINYSFGFTVKDYKTIYADSSTKLFIGPQYAPVREVFKEKAGRYQARNEIKKILITTGSTNPNHCLERLSCALREVMPNAEISVVVGGSAVFDAELSERLDLSLIEGVTDLSNYMLESDLVISAAGTTLYELCTLGVPTIAVPIVDNQLLNAKGFMRGNFGFALLKTNWNQQEIIKLIKEYISNRAGGRNQTTLH